MLECLPSRGRLRLRLSERRSELEIMNEELGILSELNLSLNLNLL